MALTVPNVVTQNGDITVVDRAGFSTYITMENADGIVFLNSHNVTFECGSLSKAFTASGIGLQLTLTPTEISLIKAEESSRFAVINNSINPPISLWEGFVFIRSVD